MSHCLSIKNNITMTVNDNDDQAVNAFENIKYDKTIFMCVKRVSFFTLFLL